MLIECEHPAVWPAGNPPARDGRGLAGLDCAGKDPRPPGGPEPDGHKAPAFSSTRLPRKVLVVDDESDLADLTLALLRCSGLDAIVAYSAQQALRTLENDRTIDALFSDIMMPGMTGLQLGEIVRRFYPHVKVVLTSGYVLPSLLAASGPPFPYVSKPYRIDAVIRLLGR